MSHPNTKAVYQAFAKGEFSPTWTTNKKDVQTEFAYDAATAKTIVYVPASYDGTKPFDVYLHVSPGNDGEHDSGMTAGQASCHGPFVMHATVSKIGVKNLL